MTEKSIAMQVGVVIRKTPGVTRWAKWAWKTVAIIPGAGPADWREMRRDGETVEYHMDTMSLELHRTDTEAYMVSLANTPPSVYVVMRHSEAPDRPFDLLLVTASAYEAQDYADTGEEIVEQVPMPGSMVAWVREWIDFHHVEEKFVKRKRDKYGVEEVDDGIGDERIRQAADVYRAPASKKRTIQ